jgi:RNA polymerase sigma-70 factor (ECF subfamily)
VYRTAVPAALDLFRRRRARREDRMAPLEDAEGAAVASPGPESDAGARELATQVDRAIETVPASRRPVLRMYLAGYSKDEIAELMGWSEAKVRNLLYRGLADLRDRLAALGIAERA